MRLLLVGLALFCPRSGAVPVSGSPGSSAPESLEPNLQKLFAQLVHYVEHRADAESAHSSVHKETVEAIDESHGVWAMAGTCSTPASKSSCGISTKSKSKCKNDNEMKACLDKWCGGELQKKFTQQTFEKCNTMCEKDCGRGGRGEDCKEKCPVAKATPPPPAPAPEPEPEPESEMDKFCRGIVTKKSGKPVYWYTRTCCRDGRCGYAYVAGGRDCISKATIQAKGLTLTCPSNEASVSEPPKASADLQTMKPSVLEMGDKESGSTTYLTPTAIEQSKPYPGVDYLGVGYDIFRGNPSGDDVYMLDPGFRQPVRVLAYSMSWVTRDGLYRTPRGSVSMPLFTCARSEKYSNIADASSYASSLAVDASISASGSGPGFGAAFKASVGYNSATNEDRSSSMYRFEAKSYCLKYRFSMIKSVPERNALAPPFVEAAIAAIKVLDGKLPDEMAQDEREKATVPWFELFNEYGTHFIIDLTVGGKVIYTRYVTQSSMQSLTTTSITASMSASGKTMSVEAGIEASVALASSQGRESASKMGGSQINIMGGVPVGDAATVEGFAAWADTVARYPMPIKYSLEPFSKLAMPIMEAFDESNDSDAADLMVEEDQGSRIVNPCDSRCYTAGTDVTNGQITVSQKTKVTWVGRCKWTEPPCWGCYECGLKPPSPPGIASPLPGAPPPPDQPAQPPPPPKLNAKFFENTYDWFLEAYAGASLQAAQLDNNNNLLSLGGGTCVDDPDWGNAVAKTWTPNNKQSPYDVNDGWHWNEHNEADLNRMCYDHCFGHLGDTWKKVQHPPNNGIELKCPALGEDLWARRPDGTYNSNEPKDRSMLRTCPELRTISPSRASMVYLAVPGCTVRPHAKDTDTCFWREDDTSPEGCRQHDGVCMWISGKGYFQPFSSPTPNVVANTFIPPNRRAKGADKRPRCVCYSECPQLQYFKESIQPSSPLYGMSSNIRCNEQTSQICSLDGHSPWPNYNNPSPQAIKLMDKTTQALAAA